MILRRAGGTWPGSLAIPTCLWSLKLPLRLPLAATDCSDFGQIPGWPFHCLQDQISFPSLFSTPPIPLPASRSFLIYIKKEDKRQILSSVPGGENKTTSTLLWKHLSKNFLQRFYMWVLSNRLPSTWEIMFVYCFRGEISTYWELKRGWSRTIVCNPKMKSDSCLENKVNVYCNAKLNAQKFAFSF